MKKGVMITFEGPDAVGKTTQIDLLTQWLRDKKVAFRLTREPGGTPVAEKIRELLLDPANAEMSSVAEALLYAAARAEHVRHVVRPALEQGEMVVCDRYIDSSLAYQGFGRELGEDRVWQVNELAMDGILPDMTFLLLMDPGQAQVRIRDRALDRLEMEGDAFKERLYQGFRTLAEKHSQRVVALDAALPPEAIAESIRLELCKRGFV